jgi:RimJ/RimL family protein N-acetyltransferase
MFTLSNQWADIDEQARAFAEFHRLRKDSNTRERTPAELLAAADEGALIGMLQDRELVAVGGLFRWADQWPELGGFRVDESWQGYGLQALMMRALMADAYAFASCEAPFCAITTPTNVASLKSIAKCGLVQAEPEPERLAAMGYLPKPDKKLFFFADFDPAGRNACVELGKVVQAGRHVAPAGVLPMRIDIAVVRTGFLRLLPN